MTDDSNTEDNKVVRLRSRQSKEEELTYGYIDPNDMLKEIAKEDLTDVFVVGLDQQGYVHFYSASGDDDLAINALLHYLLEIDDED